MNCVRNQITPLGAAVVEAMPDRKAMSRLQRRFKVQRECPTSMLFPTKDSVEGFYREHGDFITGVETNETRRPQN